MKKILLSMMLVCTAILSDAANEEMRQRYEFIKSTQGMTDAERYEVTKDLQTGSVSCQYGVCQKCME